MAQSLAVTPLTLPKPEPSLLMGVHCLPPPVSLSAPNSPHYGCCESSCSGPHSYSNTPETWLPKNPFHYSSLPFETPHYIILINHQLTSLYVFIQKLCSWGRGSSLALTSKNHNSLPFLLLWVIFFLLSTKQHVLCVLNCVVYCLSVPLPHKLMLTTLRRYQQS